MTADRPQEPAALGLQIMNKNKSERTMRALLRLCPTCVPLVLLAAVVMPVARPTARAAEAEPVTVSPSFRPVHHPTTLIGLFGTIVTVEGSSVASTDVRMQHSPSPNIVANAEYMTVGPGGPWIPDTAGYYIARVFHRLRVTLCTCERDSWLLIDDIVTGGADSRSVTASYAFSPRSADDLWGALQKAPRVLGPEPEGPPIAWIGPTSFAWITRSDTLVFDQRADSLFKVTLRARVR